MTWLPNYLQAARRLSLVGSVPQQIHSLFRDSSPVSLTAYGLATRNRSPNPSPSSGGAADAARQPSFAGVPPPGFSLRSRRGFLPAPGIEEHTSEIAVWLAKSGFKRNASRRLVSASSKRPRFRNALPRLPSTCGMSRLIASARS
jgi:hypothetical protein